MKQPYIFIVKAIQSNVKWELNPEQLFSEVQNPFSNREREKHRKLTQSHVFLIIGQGEG